MNEIAIHPTKKTWAVNTLIVAINGERKVFYPSDKLNDVLSIVAPALKEGKTVQVAILPSDTRQEFVGSFDSNYDFQYSIRGSIEEVE